MIAALYIDRLGPYPKLQGVDCWDVSRDARKYAGPHPVVAHPPCGPWGALRHLYRGDEADCAPIAIEQVRQFGGVLEHPARSKLWEYDETLSEHIGRFGAHVDRFGGVCVRIDQVEWGHVARKPTWLYMVRVAFDSLVPPYPGRKPTHYASGGRTPSSRNGGDVPEGMKVCSAAQRRRTPFELAATLVAIARTASDAS